MSTQPSQPLPSNANVANTVTQTAPSLLSSKITNLTPLRLAVVGHTNTGKTSLMRTLLRDVNFGEVKNQAATTRHVEKSDIRINNQTLVTLFDTPGLEDAGGVLDWLDDNTASRRDGIERLQIFLANSISQDEFNQEAKVIRQLLDSDIAIYVVDSREPVLSKYKDELTSLAWTAIPVMPVFNFADATDNHIDAWHDMLARRGIHVATTFDSVAFEFDDEMQLWRNLTTLLNQSEVLQYLIECRTQQWQDLLETGNMIISHFLLNIAAYVTVIEKDEDPQPHLLQMQTKVRQSERHMQQQLLDLYQFYDNTVDETEFELHPFERDPFDADVLSEYGLRTTSAAAAGAVVGFSIDAATLGATMGLGTAIGGLAGGLLSNTRLISDALTGVQRLRIDPATLTLLATRAIDLQYALRHRGHAAQHDIHINQQQSPWQPDKLPSELRKARNRPAWSTLNGHTLAKTQSLRDDSAQELALLFTR